LALAFAAARCMIRLLDSGSEPMEPLQIFRELSKRGEFPAEAVRAARENRAAMVPLFLEEIERFTSSGGTIGTPDVGEAESLFMAFHLLGEWREKSAYRPLAKLLCLPDSAAELVLGDAKTETSHCVMAAVFDGDPVPLHEIIRDTKADEFVRSRMMQTLVILAMNGDLPRADVAQFLEACFRDLEPRYDCYAWKGWVDAIAYLGLANLKDLVQKAFARRSIDPSWMSFRDFETDLRHASAHPDADPLYPDGNLVPFGDAIEELQHWACFQPEEHDDPAPGWSPSFFQEPERDPFRGVGRNDPCPCGSGKKFKKCCLNADRKGDALSVIKLS
jgi:Protein of unknown function (DUF1186)/SEC-C motif